MNAGLGLSICLTIDASPQRVPLNRSRSVHPDVFIPYGFASESFYSLATLWLDAMQKSRENEFCNIHGRDSPSRALSLAKILGGPLTCVSNKSLRIKVTCELITNTLQGHSISIAGPTSNGS